MRREEVEGREEGGSWLKEGGVKMEVQEEKGR